MINFRQFIVWVGVLAVFLGIALYAAYEFRHVIRGPEIQITYPKNGSTLSEKVITFRGITKNISFLSMNDKEIFIDTEGRFRETRALPAGYNVVKIYGRDRHGGEETKKIELYIEP